MTKPKRVLTVAHMDPRLSNGGAEIAAWQLHSFLSAQHGIDACFMSCAPGKIELRDGIVLAQPFDCRSFVYGGGPFDHFSHSNNDDAFYPSFSDLLLEYNPSVIHFHHYTNIGVESLALARNVIPHARIIITLHEYLAICAHYGQMVTRPGLSLCEASEPRKCAKCFPDRTIQDFFLRDLYIRKHLLLADGFISPSQFLAERYIRWGLPANRFRVIENGSIHAASDGAEAIDPARRHPGRFRLGFFGQISALKGIDVLIAAAGRLKNAGSSTSIEIHGDYSSQPVEFQTRFLDALRAAPDNIVYHGPYRNGDVLRLMRKYDAIIVPSIWWENSPLVIQEALASRVPLICSNVGGMAEKVRDGLDGFHFDVGSSSSLADLISSLEELPEKLFDVRKTIALPPTIAETAQKVIDFYGFNDY